jgi:hypothetical protein
VQVLTAGDSGDAAPLPPAEAAALDAAVLAAYRQKGITTDPRTWRRPAPLLADLTEALTAHGKAGEAVAARLQPYVTGSFSGPFNGPTTHPPRGHLVVYAIKDLADELQPAGVLLILDTIWRTITSSRQGERTPRIVLVDEAWRLLRGGARRQVPVPASQVRPQIRRRAVGGHPGRGRRPGHGGRPGGRIQRGHPDLDAASSAGNRPGRRGVRSHRR